MTPAQLAKIKARTAAATTEPTVVVITPEMYVRDCGALIAALEAEQAHSCELAAMYRRLLDASKEVVR